MNHNSVRTSLDIRVAARQRIVHALFKNQRFASGNNHKLLRAKRILSGCNLGTEVLDGVLSLLNLGAEERVFLETRLILYDDHRYSHTFQ